MGIKEMGRVLEKIDERVENVITGMVGQPVSLPGQSTSQEKPPSDSLESYLKKPSTNQSAGGGYSWG